MSDLDALHKSVAALSLFSPNESLEDISTRDLIYLLVPYVSAEAQERVMTPERSERIVSLNQSQVRCASGFMHQIHAHLL